MRVPPGREMRRRSGGEPGSQRRVAQSHGRDRGWVDLVRQPFDQPGTQPRVRDEHYISRARRRQRHRRVPRDHPPPRARGPRVERVTGGVPQVVIDPDGRQQAADEARQRRGEAPPDHAQGGMVQHRLALPSPHYSRTESRAWRAGGATGAGGTGPPTTADFVPVTRRGVPTPWPLCRRRAGRKGSEDPSPQPPPHPRPVTLLRVQESCGGGCGPEESTSEAAREGRARGAPDHRGRERSDAHFGGERARGLADEEAVEKGPAARRRPKAGREA